MMRALTWLLCWCALGCAERLNGEDAASRVPMPVADPTGALCVDVGSERVCWSVSGDASHWPRALPDLPAPPGGFRCGGFGESHVCEARSHNGPGFACASGACIQERPRMPDLGEWECVELDGMLMCHDRGAAAGIARGGLELGWVCGHVRADEMRERVCLDLDPDRPSADMRFTCRFEHVFGVAQRRCVAARAPQLGDRCAVDTACPDAMSCKEGLCLPTRPEPACWLDRDCAVGSSCRRGTCESAVEGHGAVHGALPRRLAVEADA